MLSRLLLWLAIGFAITLIYRLYRVRQRRTLTRHPRMINKNMVRCGHCGTYIPEDQALAFNGQHYCTEEHKTLATHKT